MLLRNKDTGREIEASPENFMITELCHLWGCSECPLKHEESCHVYVREHWREAVKKLGWEIVGENGESEDKTKEPESSSALPESPEIPPLCQILGVEPFQMFWIQGEDLIWLVDLDGVRRERRDGKWFPSYDEAGLVDLIQHREELIRGGVDEEFRAEMTLGGLTEELRRVLPGLKRVVREDEELWLEFDRCGNGFRTEFDLEEWKKNK